MTICDLPSGVMLDFETSGVRVVPAEVTFESKPKKYRHARVRMTREAGLHIHENADAPEAVLIRAGNHGDVLARLYLPKNSITLGTDEAHVNLLDPIHILEEDNCDYKNEAITFGSLVDTYLREKVLTSSLNHNRVIAGVQIANPDYLDDLTTSWEHEYGDVLDKMGRAVRLLDRVQPGGGAGMRMELVDYAESKGFNLIEPARHAVLEAYDSLIGLEEEDGGVDFKDDTISAAVAEIEETFDVAAWVDDDGILWFGPETAHTEMYYAGDGIPGLWTISDYNVTISPYKTTQSKVLGGWLVTIDESERNFFSQSESVASDANRLRTWATAHFGDNGAIAGEKVPPAAEGSTIRTETNVTSVDTLERKAKRMLLDRALREHSGNIEISVPTSSRRYGSPADIAVGDRIGVIPPEGGHENCGYNTSQPAVYLVNSVQHKIDATNGWTVTLGVGAIPARPIYVTSFEKALDDEDWLTEDEFKKNRGIEVLKTIVDPRTSLRNETVDWVGDKSYTWATGYFEEQMRDARNDVREQMGLHRDYA